MSPKFVGVQWTRTEMPKSAEKLFTSSSSAFLSTRSSSRTS